MAATTDMPALTINQRGAIETLVMDYAASYAALVVAEAGTDTDRITACKHDVAHDWRAVCDWLMDVRYVDPAIGETTE